MPLPKALAYSFSYIIVNAFFGLAPLWIVLELTVFENVKAYEEIIREGVITYFCIAIIGSVSFDYVLSKPKANEVIYYLIIALPFILLFVVSGFAIMSRLHGKEGNYYLGVLTWVSGCITVGYCMIVKTKIFLAEKH